MYLLDRSLPDYGIICVANSEICYVAQAVAFGDIAPRCYTIPIPNPSPNVVCPAILPGKDIIVIDRLVSGLTLCPTDCDTRDIDAGRDGLSRMLLTKISLSSYS
jgi:hypothetical protein